MSTLMQANHQWMSRPSDERFVSLTDLQTAMRLNRENSHGRAISTRQIEAQPVDGDHQALVIVGPNGTPVSPTHWSFGQVAGLADAPAGYLRKLPAAIAADCINYGLRFTRDIEDVGVLLRKQANGDHILAAATGPNYGRVWNSTMADALISRFGDGVTGDFRVPGEFGKRVAITKENTTIFAGDRDMFVFLADEEHRVEIPNRRDGKPGQLARGFFVWNSEVGSASFGIATFLFDYVCCNRIVWGATGFKEVRFKHTASAPDKFVEQVAPAMIEYANSSTVSITEAIANAKKKKVDDVADFLKKRFTKREIGSIIAAHQMDEQRPMETIWDVTVGVTAYARGLSWQDQRVTIERKAGDIMDLAA